MHTVQCWLKLHAKALTNKGNYLLCKYLEKYIIYLQQATLYFVPYSTIFCNFHRICIVHNKNQGQNIQKQTLIEIQQCASYTYINICNNKN